MAIPHAFIQDLIARADVVDVVGRYVTLKKAGVNFKGLCPFHGEKTPSFIVSPVRQTYHCFGCGAHGDALRFLMEHNGLGFIEAVKDLAQQMGLQVPEEHVSPQQRAVEQQRKAKQLQLTDVLAQAAQYWQAALLKDQRALAYAQRRGLSKETLSRYAIGYAAHGWQELAKVFTNYDDPLLVESGLVIEAELATEKVGAQSKRYDRFRDRLMFPIRNVKGEVIGFGGRVMGQGEPKYLNSPETPVFLKGHELYGLYEARSEIRHHNHVLITEGYMDVVALAQHGFTNAVATLGTACTPEHIQKIFKFTDSIVFSFDGDIAGRKAARRALEIVLPFAKDTRVIRFLFLPQEHDPDSFIQQQGADAFKQVVAQALPLSQFLLEAARQGCDLAVPEGRARMLSQAYALWSLLPQGGLAIQLLAEIAVAGQMSVENLQGLWAQQAEQRPVAQEHYSSVKQGQGYDTANGTPQGRAAARWQRDTQGYGTYPGGRNAKRYGTKWGGWKGKDEAPRMPPLGAAQAPMTPIDHCIRILMVHSNWWEDISSTDQEMLCTQHGWRGAFFKWLERLVIDQGGMNWAALSQAAQSEPWYDMAMVLTQGPFLDVETEPQELQICLERVRNAKAMEDSVRILQQFKARS